jgi:hypothetical protein
MTNSPIFQSTSQAIHFSFLIEAYEPGAESAMGKILRRHLEETGQAMGEREPSSIDFDGLSAMEVRGQAAMIRSAINTHLTPCEAWAIKAKYGQTKTIERHGKPKSYIFTPERVDAMRNLARNLAPNYSSIPSNAVVWLVARACGELEHVRPTFRDIEEQAGGSKSELCRVFPQVKKSLRELENRSIDKLTPIFQREGIVPDSAFA